MKKTTFLLLLISFFGAAQEQKDTLAPQDLKEVIVIGKKNQLHEKQSKSLATLDEFLDKASSVDMVKRGAYAWEPLINNMSSERTLITIDGMRIFGACTDKMDPVTSYVEVSNLSEANIHSGQQGSCFGSTIGGAIDLKLNENKFAAKKWDFAVNTGFEFNNQQKIVGASTAYTDSIFYINTDVMYRKADNYFDGSRNEILYSQFEKINLSGTTGWKFKPSQMVEASVIYDKATNVGYPALPMDISLAEALITSLKYMIIPQSGFIKNWESKIYFNAITHRMDDTTRPNVPIHMDMPGWSKTYGMYSKVNGVINKHHWLLNWNSFYNKSLAEMTMYPENPNENLMFMYTWPDIRTLYNGVFIEDNWVLNCHSGIKFSASIGLHSNMVNSKFGLESLRIFYPEARNQKNRVLKSVGLNYNYNQNNLQIGLGTAYSERAPSVSEGYGFYLFNSFDGFDYIGNPNLRNEQSVEGNFLFGYKIGKLNVKWNGSIFRISNYILGIPDSSLIAMTIGANGVKIYKTLNYATIFNTYFSTEYSFTKQLKWNTRIGISQGKSSDRTNLPFITPLNYTSTLFYSKGKINAELSIAGNASQTNYNSFFGEDKTPDFAVINASIGYKIALRSCKLLAKLGVENALDTTYSTYSDWNNLPRMGRNVFMNLIYQPSF